MKLELQSLTLRNFQSFQERTISFTRETNISGDNGTGKTTIYSALTWLLFGKDAKGQADFDIKRKVNGIKTDKVDVEVEGVFFLTTATEAYTLTLKRVLHEKWSKENYKGDETLTYWDGVPLQITEYKKKISSLIEEEDFRMVTNLGYFQSKDTSFKRGYLCKMAGVKSLQDVCSERKEWMEFLYKLSGRDIADYMKIQKVEKDRLSKDLDNIQPAINALITSMPELLEWDILNAEKEAIQAQIRQLDEKLQGNNARIEMASSTQKALIEKRMAIERKISDLKSNWMFKVSEEKRLKKNELFKKDESRNQLAADVRKIEVLRESKISEKESLERDYDRFVKQLATYTDQYNEENKKVFSFNHEGATCPLAGHKCNAPALMELLAQKREEKETEFNRTKQELIESILKDGKSVREKRDDAKVRIEQLDKEIIDLTTTVSSLKSNLDATPVYAMQEIEIDETELPGYKQHIDNLLSLESELLNQKKEIESYSPEKVDNNGIIDQKKELNISLESVINKLANRNQIDKINEQINGLKVKAKELSAKICDIDNDFQTAFDINKFIVDDATERVNRMFNITRWELFRQCNNGNYEPVCYATHNGVIDKSINTAMTINISLDICNVISKFLNIQVPIFIDCRESANEIIPTNNQIINLRVAPQGTPLTID